MSDDEADPELLELLRQSLGITRRNPDEISSETGVLKDAQFIYNNAIDVSVDMLGTKAAAVEIYRAMQRRSYSTEAWSQHELHPKPSEGFADIDILNFVFTMDLLNFSFWSELSESDRFQVEYKDKRWTGYNSLVACMRRALDENIPLTTPRFWRSPQCSDELLAHVFRSATAEQIPLLNERMEILRDAGMILQQNFADPNEDDGFDEMVDEKAAPTQPSAAADSSAVDGHERQADKQIDVPSDNDNRPDQGVLDETQQGLANFEEAEAGLAVQSGKLAEDNGPGSCQIKEDHPLNTELAVVAAQDDALPGPTGMASHGGAQDGFPGNYKRSSIDDRPDHSVVRLIKQADRSAGKLVNILAKFFPHFRDEHRFDGRKVRILKRAQIFVADLWAALHGRGLGEFHDIDHLTMFADYRVTQCLHSLGVLSFSPPLDHHIRSRKHIPSGHAWEVQLRGCSIWAVELIRREIVSAHSEAEGTVNAVLLDFFLYDLAKEKEAEAVPSIPTHRTRSEWY